MNNWLLKFCTILLSVYSCNSIGPQSMDEDTWKLGWRMVENSWDGNDTLVETQFDSLLQIEQSYSQLFYNVGLEAKMKLGKNEEVIKILQNLSPTIRSKVCKRDFATQLSICVDHPKEEIENKKLQTEILKMYLNDQASRGNVMSDVIDKYNVDTTKIFKEGVFNVNDNNRERVKAIIADYGYSDENIEIINNYMDSQSETRYSLHGVVSENNMYEQSIFNASGLWSDIENHERLAEIINEFGFPTRRMIGKEAMNGVFLIIQHADPNKEWQKSQLPNLKLASEKGELTKSNYAYLYDRIQVNSDRPQRYGSQFENVDRKSNIAELRPTEDMENLDKRRMEMEMMPIETYKRLMLSH